MKYTALLLFVLSSSLLCAQKNEKYEKRFAAINEKGEMVFDFWAKWARGFENGMAEITKYVVVGNKAYWNTGFINSEGRISVPCDYERANSFHTDVTFVKKRGRDEWQLIDKNGKQVTTRTFENVGYFFGGFCEFETDNGQGFINRKGEVVIPDKYVGAGYFAEGLVCLSPVSNPNAAYGFLDTNGQVVIPHKYNQAGFSSFEEGLARVKVNGRTALINKKGEIVVQPVWGTVSGFGEGLLMVAQGNAYNDFGYADFNNKLVIKGPFYNVKAFKHGRAVVGRTQEEDGIIDKNGEFIIPFGKYTLFNELEEEGGYIAKMYDVLDDQGEFETRAFEYFDKDGEPFTDVPVSRMMRPEDGNLIPFQDPETELWGYLTKTGELAVEPQFEEARAYGKNGLAIVKLADGHTPPSGLASSSTSTSSSSSSSSSNSDGSGSSASATDANGLFKVGTLVLAQWSDGKWYPAQVSSASKSGYGVKYYDGYTGNNNRHKVKAFDWKTGDTIYVNWKSKGTWYKAKIDGASEGKLQVTYDSDRSKDAVELKLCRSM